MLYVNYTSERHTGGGGERERKKERKEGGRRGERKKGKGEKTKGSEGPGSSLKKKNHTYMIFSKDIFLAKMFFKLF